MGDMDGTRLGTSYLDSPPTHQLGWVSGCGTGGGGGAPPFGTWPGWPLPRRGACARPPRAAGAGGRGGGGGGSQAMTVAASAERAPGPLALSWHLTVFPFVVQPPALSIS